MIKKYKYERLNNNDIIIEFKYKIITFIIEYNYFMI